MNAEDAIEKIRKRQQQLIDEAQKMSDRAERLQTIAECQDPQGGGYRWEAVRVDLTGDEMKAERIYLQCAKSGIRIEAIMIHPTPLIVDQETTLREFLEGDEEE
tara:strand:+ start:299 stop:610 length:312 start_codon:yes stop_codon:yes gene_type:complete